MHRALALSSLALLAAGCGGLGTPDLSRGVVEGRILNQAGSAYVYAYGTPSAITPVAADGSFRLTAPAGTTAIVLVDPDAGLGSDLAELVDVTVEGADVVHVADRHGARDPVTSARMPIAGAILAGVTAVGGAVPQQPSFTLDGTDRSAAAVTGASALLARVPAVAAGRLALTVAMRGFKGKTVQVPSVAAGTTTAVQVALDVDSEATEKGCAAAGDQCESEYLP